MEYGVPSEGECADIWFQDEHLRAFRESVHANHDPDDGNTKWGQAFGEGLPNVDVAVLPEKRVKRSCVLKLASNLEINLHTVCTAIFAWGGMNLRHRDSLFNESGPEWLKVAQDVRCGAIDRMTAYDRLKELRSQKRLKGIGPAYFTKLIYFLTPRHSTALKTGYIMDQWAGCSVNLLVGREVVLMNVTKTWKRQTGRLAPSFAFMVSDENTGDNYEAFCSAVDRLASCFGINDEQVDRALVSTGGRNPEFWRQYVMDQRQSYICSGVKLSGALTQ